MRYDSICCARLLMAFLPRDRPSMVITHHQSLRFRRFCSHLFYSSASFACIPMLLLTNQCDYSAWSHLLLLLPAAAQKLICRYVDNKGASDVFWQNCLSSSIYYCVACSSRLYGGMDFINDISAARGNVLQRNNSYITHLSTSSIACWLGMPEENIIQIMAEFC